MDIERRISVISRLSARALFEDLLAHRLLDDAVERIADFVGFELLAEAFVQFRADSLVGIAAFARRGGNELRMRSFRCSLMAA